MLVKINEEGMGEILVFLTMGRRIERKKWLLVRRGRQHFVACCCNQHFVLKHPTYGG